MGRDRAVVELVLRSPQRTLAHMTSTPGTTFGITLGTTHGDVVRSRHPASSTLASRWQRTPAFLMLLALSMAMRPGEMAGADAVVIEASTPMPSASGMGTKAYEPTPTELPFTNRITEKPISFESGADMPKPENESEEQWRKEQAEMKAEQAKCIPIASYSLAAAAGQFVGWSGILRGASFDQTTGRTTWTIQHTYFDGMEDLAMHIVSLYGAGDFQVVLPGDHRDIRLLSLVLTYGPVTVPANSLPMITAAYVRTWDWGLFTFMDYGVDRSNAQWTRLRTMKPEEIYKPFPDRDYYVARLGQRPAAGPASAGK